MSNNVTPLHHAANANEDACARLEAAARSALPGATVDVVANPALTGYRKLSEAETALINEIKRFAIGLGDMVAELMTNPDTDKRWVSIGATHLQQGLMAVTRAVAKPTTF